MVTSNSIQNLVLNFNDNLVVKSHAVIFVCSKLKRDELEELESLNHCENSKFAEDLFKNIWKFNIVEVLREPSKANILAKLQML